MSATNLCASWVSIMRRQAQWQELPSPKVEKGQIRIQVEAAGLNQADLLQIKVYILERSRIEYLGLNVQESLIRLARALIKGLGRKVCALLRGGGISEYICAPHQ